jgi:hypothetical protein
MQVNPWTNIILDSSSASETWQNIFTQLQELALSSPSPVDLHNQTMVPDRLLAETAWELWTAYPLEAPKTSQVLQQWCQEASHQGRAVLVLDAWSLRELPFLLGGAEVRGIVPVSVRVTGSEAPSDTDQFARALGVPSRSHLKNNNPPAGFSLFGDKVYTDVPSLPFEDCVGHVPHETNLFLWHTWLDDLIHVHKKQPDQITNMASTVLQSDGFWQLVDRLRQGRRLIITADHGYAVSRFFATEEDPEVKAALRDAFGGSRSIKATTPWQEKFMPPHVTTVNDFHLVIGQRKWSVPSGFPHICHGGLSLLEVAVPFVELPPL